MTKIKIYRYAGLTVRIKAMFADIFFLVVMMFVISNIFDGMEEVSDTTRKIAFISLFGVYEPLMVSLFGGTIGHYVCKLRIRRESNPEKKINPIVAVFRFAVKGFLGIFSLMTIGASEKSKTIHDSLAGSVVLDLNEMHTGNPDVVSKPDLKEDDELLDN
jgi:uncharacterized RDD family membrane protein YckC